MAEAPVRLRSRVIDDNDVGVGKVRWARRLGDDVGGVGRGQGIYDASKGSETTTDVVGYRQRPQGIYDDNGGIGRGR